VPYAGNTFIALRGQLAERLNDPGKVFSTDAELALHIQDAIRFWNILTGDNKVNFNLPIQAANPVWYDLFTVANSPLLCTLTDRDIYLRITYALLEPPSNIAAVTTGQFVQDEIVNAVQRKRDEFLFLTGCRASIQELNVTANIAGINLPQTVIQVRRGYWLPNDVLIANPLFRLDEFSIAAYQPFGPNTPNQPIGYSVGVEPPLKAEIMPPPKQDGVAEFIVSESQAVLSAQAATTIFIPNDFVPGLMWGAIADLLNFNLEAQDPTRAGIAQQRFLELEQLMTVYPFVFGARVNGVAIFSDAVENLDMYQPAWRTATANPNFVALSGNNLIAYPSNQAMNITLLMLANANVPVNDNDAVQLGDEVLDVILDEAQATASFKMGGQEAAAAHQLHGNIIKLAAKRNAKVRAMACFRDVLYGRTQREGQISPLEVNYGDDIQ
jgi:hypothetical protein